MPKRYINRLISLSLVLLAIPILFFVTSKNVNAVTTATLSANPDVGTYSSTTPFNIVITLDGGGQTFNAAQANISLKNLKVQSFQLGNCNFTFVKTPMKSSLNFAGAILGKSSKGCTVFTITVLPSTGLASLVMKNTEVLADDKHGTEILRTVTGGEYRIGSGPAPSVSTTIMLVATPTPSVSSSASAEVNNIGKVLQNGTADITVVAVIIVFVLIVGGIFFIKDDKKNH